MSAPFNIVTCSECNSAWPTHVSWGHFEYYLGSGDNIPIDRDVGWCHGCDGFRPVEVVPDAAVLKERIDNTEKVLAALRRDREKIQATRWRRWILFIVPAPRKMTLELRDLNRGLRELQNTLRWRSQRLSPERCLDCGSTHVQHVDWGKSTTWRWEGLLRLALEHPHCGGTMVVRHSGAWLAMAIESRRVYDPEGRFLREVPTAHR